MQNVERQRALGAVADQFFRIGRPGVRVAIGGKRQAVDPGQRLVIDGGGELLLAKLAARA